MPIAPGSAAPDLAALDLEGRSFRLASLWAAGPALLFFFKDECAACEVAAPVLPRFAAVPGLALAAVSQDGPGPARAMAAAAGWGPAVRRLVDPEPWPAAEALGLRSTPTWVLVERGGRVAAVAEGWSRDDANGLAARAASLAGSAAPVVARPDGPEPALRPG